MAGQMDDPPGDLPSGPRGEPPSATPEPNTESGRPTAPGAREARP